MDTARPEYFVTWQCPDGRAGTVCYLSGKQKGKTRTWVSRKTALKDSDRSEYAIPRNAVISIHPV